MTRAMSSGDESLWMYQRARLDARQHVLLVGEHRDHERLAPRVELDRGPDHVEPAAVGQSEVHEQDVDTVRGVPQPVQRRLDRREGSRERQFVRAPDAVTEEIPRAAVVLDDEHLPHVSSHGLGETRASASTLHRSGRCTSHVHAIAHAVGVRAAGARG